MPLNMVEIPQWQEREREREKREPFKVLLFCLHISQTHFVFLLHSMVWTLGLPGQKLEDVQQQPYKSLQGQSCTVCSSGVGAGCAGPKTNCYKNLHVVLFPGSFEHMIT
jgi:hypothetical protein